MTEVRIHGLDRFARGVGGMRRALSPRVHRFLRVAALLVAREAVPRVPIGPSIAGHARQTVHPFFTATSAGVVGGGDLYPYYGWLEFGGTISPKGTPIRRPYLKKGRYIWSAFSDERESILEDAHGVIRNLGVSFGIDVDRG